MSTGSKTVLFVDDELPLLQLVGELMRHRSGGTWEVLLADTAAKALEVLKERRIDLLVVDARMPVMNGLQLIRLARPRHPDIPVVLLTGYAEEQSRDAYQREGVDVILEKPRSPEAYETLFLTLTQMLEMQRSHGFRGLLDRVELQDVIQLECLRRNSSILEVFTSTEAGEIVIKGGLIVHAQCGDLTGEPAFNRLLTLRGGEFRLKAYEEPAQVTIGKNWEYLLMEAARLRDEQAENAESEAGTGPELPRQTFTAPAIELNESEQRLANPAVELVAVSVDGVVLLTFGASEERNAALTRVARAVEMWPGGGIGKPELFEAKTANHEVAVEFQPEAIVVASRRRTGDA